MKTTIKRFSYDEDGDQSRLQIVLEGSITPQDATLAIALIGQCLDGRVDAQAEKLLKSYKQAQQEDERGGILDDDGESL